MRTMKRETRKQMKNTSRFLIMALEKDTPIRYRCSMTSLDALKNIGIEVRSHLDKIVPDSAWGSDLCGACAVGAYVTWKLGTRAGIDCRFVMGENRDESHCWLEAVIEGQVYVLDVTATQFGKYPTVLLLPASEYNQFTWASSFKKRFVNRNALRRLIDWPSFQQPKTYRKQLLSSKQGKTRFGAVPTGMSFGG